MISDDAPAIRLGREELTTMLALLGIQSLPGLTGPSPVPAVADEASIHSLSARNFINLEDGVIDEGLHSILTASAASERILIIRHFVRGQGPLVSYLHLSGAVGILHSRGGPGVHQFVRVSDRDSLSKIFKSLCLSAEPGDGDGDAMSVSIDRSRFREAMARLREGDAPGCMALLNSHLPAAAGVEHFVEAIEAMTSDTIIIEVTKPDGGAPTGRAVLLIQAGPEVWVGEVSAGPMGSATWTVVRSDPSAVASVLEGLLGGPSGVKPGGSSVS